MILNKMYIINLTIVMNLQLINFNCIFNLGLDF